MSPGSRSVKLAYVLHGVLSLLVLGAMGWATAASLRLERAEQAERLADERQQYHVNIQLTMNRMEGLASALLSAELQRPAADYAPLYFLDNAEVREATGEMLPAGQIVKVSPLLSDPPRADWLLIHFQASTRGGFQSPELVPEEALDWPDFADQFDVGQREQYATVLASLRYSLTVDELTDKYRDACGYHDDAVAAEESDDAEATERMADGLELIDTSASVGAPQSDFNRRMYYANLVQRPRTPPVICTQRELAMLNLNHMTHGTWPDGEFASESALSDDEIGVVQQMMRPVWIKLANRPTVDLAFLHAVQAAGETALRGFIVDWPKFRNRLLTVARTDFPKAEIETIDKPLTAADVGDDTVFSLMHARLVTHVPEPGEMESTWSSTHTFQLVSWAAAFVLLAAVGLGIHSLVRLSERRSQFAYAVTHELRTPLTTFRLYTDMLAQGMVSEENRQEYLDTLNSESRRLADLVSGVLEHSRIENNSVPVNREPVPVGDILSEVREYCGPRCEASKALLRIEECPTADDAITTDRQLAVQIIGNLIDNACKYGRNGEDTEITVSARKSGTNYHFDVADCGPGVPPQLRSSIFKPYERGDTESAPATGGIGLGLALSKSWARMLGGQLELVPNPRGVRGARFRFTVPMNR
jgi:signal transduction histidine kinase